MTDGLLENIIHLEKQIQANVAKEQVRAGQWQERELATLESSLVEARTAIEEQRKQALIKKKAQLLPRSSRPRGCGKRLVQTSGKVGR